MEHSDPVLEDFCSWRSRLLNVSFSMDGERSSRSSMPQRRSPYRGLPRAESPIGENGLYGLGMSTMLADHAKDGIPHETGKTIGRQVC